MPFYGILECIEKIDCKINFEELKKLLCEKYGDLEEGEIELLTDPRQSIAEYILVVLGLNETSTIITDIFSQ